MLFRDPPQIETQTDFMRDRVGILLRQRTATGQYVQVVRCLPRMDQDMPARMVIEILNRDLARQLAQVYEEHLKAHPYV